MGLGWRQACQVGSGRLSGLLGGNGDLGVGGGGQGVRGMGAFGGDAGEEPVEVGTRVEAAPQAAADEAVEDGPCGGQL